MDSVSTLITIISYVILAIVGSASALALFRVRFAKTTIEELRGDRDDQAKRIERLEKENQDSEKRREKQDIIISKQADEIKVLREALSGKAQLDHLQEQLDAHDRRIDERHTTLAAMLQEVVKTISGLAENNQALTDSNSYLQAALIDFLRRQEVLPSDGDRTE